VPLDLARLSALAFLHDCGKLHPGFQAKAWPAETWRHAFVGHLPAGAALFTSSETERLAHLLNIEALAAWGVDYCLLYAVLAHHGQPFAFDEHAGKGWQKVDATGYDPSLAAEEMGRAMQLWFAAAFADGGEPLPPGPDFQHLLCGLVMLADWLGSTEKIFFYVPDFDPDYWSNAQVRA